jgi:hypothetical protein
MFILVILYRLFIKFLLKNMKNLLFAFTLLIGFVMPAHADKEVADRAIRCSALIYIELTRPEMSGLTAGEALMNRIYAYQAITGLTQDYIKGITLAEEYRGCIYWMTDVAKFINISEYVSQDNRMEEAEEMALFLSAPTESSVTIYKNPIETWEQQVDLGFAAWASQELKVPYKEAILVKVSEKFE